MSRHQVKKIARAWIFWLDDIAWRYHSLVYQLLGFASRYPTYKSDAFGFRIAASI